jgi:hypothetical protein
MLQVIEDCCSTSYLDMLKFAAMNSTNWNLKYPIGMPFEDKHLKLDIIENEPVDEMLAGMAMGLLIQIYDSKTYNGIASKNLFSPEVSYCGISMKDRHRPDNKHIDHEHDTDYIKIVGLLNSNWNSKDGGLFEYGDESIPMVPTNFVVFDPRIPHCASEILTNEKRLGIDFTVKKK